jgi:hypothetical protein
LRGITGGCCIDRWPIKVDAAEDETPRSWFRRVSDRYQLTPRQLCDALGVDPPRLPEMAVFLNQNSDIVNTALDVQVEDFNTACGENLRSPWLAPFTESTHRFCPACLEENSYWKTSWESPFAVACPVHRILYVDQCPQCGERPWRTDAWLGQCGAVHACAARRPAEADLKQPLRAWCGGDLRKAPRPLAPETVLQAQAILAGNKHWTAEASAPAPLHRFDIGTQQSREVLATLVGAAWTRTQSDPLTANRRADALHVGIVAYQELMTAEQPTPYLDQLTVVMNLDQVLAGGPGTVGIYGPVIAAWYIDRVRGRLTRRQQLGWRTDRKWPSTPCDPTTPWATAQATLPQHQGQPSCVPAAWVPQLIAVDSLQLPWKPDAAGRALAAMCLLNLGRGIRWAYIALELGLPASLQHILASRLANTPSQAWQQFLSSLEDTFDHLCKSPPQINYRLRRIIAADPQLIRRCVAKRTDSKPQDVPQDAITAVWAEYTGGDIHFAPPTIAPESSTSKAGKLRLSGVATEIAQEPLYAQICEDIDAAATEHSTREQAVAGEARQRSTGCIHKLLERLIADSDQRKSLKFVSLDDVQRSMTASDIYTRRTVAATFAQHNIRVGDIIPTLANSWRLDNQLMQ